MASCSTMQEYIAFMNRHRVSNDTPTTEQTHYDMSGGAYIIEDDSQVEFYRLYGDRVQELLEGQFVNLHIVERHASVSPVLVDLDFDVPVEKQHVVDFCVALMKSYDTFCRVPDDASAVVFKRHEGNGIHVVVPEIITHPSLQLAVRMKLLECMDAMFPGCNKDFENVYDKNVLTENGPWTMFGSFKPPTKDSEIPTPPYLPKYSVKQDGSTDDYVVDKDVSKEVKRFSIRNKSFTTTLTPYGENVIRQYIESIAERVEKTKIKRESDLECEDVLRLLEMLSQKRASDYNKWLDVGFALGNTFADNPEEGLRLFDLFSQKDAVKYDASYVEDKWNRECIKKTERANKLTLGSIKYWAKEDSPKKYAAYIKMLGEKNAARISEEWPEDVAQMATGCEEPVADYIVKNCFGGDIVCVDSNKYVFYVFDGRMWIRKTGVNLIKHDITSKAHPMYTKLVDKYQTKLNGVKDTKTEEYEMWLKRHKMISDVAVRLKTRRFVDNLMTYVAGHPMVYDKDFENMLDLNPHKFPCKNGLVDLMTGVVTDFVKTDYVTKTAPFVYDPEAKSETFDKFIRDITCDDEELIVYLQTLFGYSLTGSMQENITPFLIGKGGSGVSTVINLLKDILGPDLAKKVPNDLICRVRQSKSSNTDYERARLKGARLALFAELSSDMQFNSDFLTITGGDAQNARKAYEDAGEFKPTYMSLCYGNSMPKHAEDMSLNNYMRRIRLIILRCVFDADPVAFRKANPYYEGEVKQLDTTMSSKLAAEIVGVFNWIVEGAMRWYHECEMKLDNVRPASVKKDTIDYLGRTDTFSCFVQDECFLGPHMRDEDGNAIQNGRGGFVTNAVSSAALLNAWHKYSDKETKMDADVFKNMLLSRYKDKGVSKPDKVTIDGKNVRGYRGISLRCPYKWLGENKDKY